MKNSEKTAIILLSGGLDSLVCISKSKQIIKMGLLFDYGQNAFSKEKAAAEKIAKFYDFPLKIIKLDWLENIINNGLTNKEKSFYPVGLGNQKELEKSMQSVWVPNRNALFINIAAAFCENYKINSIIIGANKEEATTFKDNSTKFIENCNKLLETSTNTGVDVVAPLINMDKNEIIKTAIDLNAPLEFVYSCYLGGEKHCGKCESCLHLKNALLSNDRNDLINKLF